MIHINSRMSGIARYSAWGVLSLIFFVILFYNDLITIKNLKKIISYILIFSILLTGFTVLKAYHLHIDFSPIAQYVLDNYPSLYNPLHSTFNSRINHIDGGYKYQTPIMYCAKDEYIRKILTKSDDKELLFSVLSSDNGYDEWLKNEINNLSDSESYISCSYEKRIICAYPYNIGDILSFKSSSPTANKYVINNIYSPESWGTWTSGNSLSMHMKTDSLSPVLHGEINANVYNNVQSVTVYVNDKPVFNEPAFKGGTINFDFENPGKNKPIKIRIELPDAISPSENGAGDTRILALGMIDMVINE
ncbi:MAG: hypothetical protein IJ736_05855 [Firmicutes bacterium]|nr:hypothetical protein [Bacillota bacterium]